MDSDLRKNEQTKVKFKIVEVVLLQLVVRFRVKLVHRKVMVIVSIYLVQIQLNHVALRCVH